MGAACAARGRSALLEEYQQQSPVWLERLHDYGFAVDAETVDHALAPVPDKPFLSCIAKLPQPGSQLVTEQAVVQGGGATAKPPHTKTTKKKQGKQRAGSPKK